MAKKKQKKKDSNKFHLPQKWSFPGLVLCTFLVALAQFLLKNGSNHLAPTLEGTVFNISLVLGAGLYFVNAVLFILIIKNMDISVAYPTMSLSFVWVFIISYLAFNEPLSPWSLFGVVMIIIGVVFLGRSVK
jgi:multidrug transporter EmrE-like cation transporter